MRANELRLGNWVQTKQTEKQFQVTVYAFQVVSIVDSQYKPIPLTEEWLTRFGFDKIESAIPTAYRTKSGFRIKEDERGYWMQHKHGLVIIKHVHQLQNLHHALTGEELIISEEATI